LSFRRRVGKLTKGKVRGFPMSQSIFHLAGATALCATLAAGAGHASVVVSDAFAGQEATQGNPLVLDVDGNGIDDLEINVFVPIVVDPGDIQDPGSVVPLSIEIDEPVNGENGGSYTPLPEGANIRGLPIGTSGGVASRTVVATEVAPDWVADATPFAPGETVEADDFVDAVGIGRLYGRSMSPHFGPSEPELNEIQAFDLMIPDVAGPIPNVGDSAFFGFRITTGTPGVDYSEPIENAVDTFGWIELTHGSVIVGQVGLQSLPGAGAPVPGGPSEVPVPAAGLLLMGGLAGLGALRRRRAPA
jgi:hypothetical protein